VSSSFAKVVEVAGKGADHKRYDNHAGNYCDNDSARASESQAGQGPVQQRASGEQSIRSSIEPLPRYQDSNDAHEA